MKLTVQHEITKKASQNKCSFFSSMGVNEWCVKNGCKDIVEVVAN